MNITIILSYSYKVVVFIDPLQGLYTILLEKLKIVYIPHTTWWLNTRGGDRATCPEFESHPSGNCRAIKL